MALIKVPKMSAKAYWEMYHNDGCDMFETSPRMKEFYKRCVWKKMDSGGYHRYYLGSDTIEEGIF